MDSPQITVTAPRLRYWQWITLRISLPMGAVLVFAVVTGISSHNSGMLYGALFATGAVIVIAAIEIPLIRGAVARRERRVRESSPAGTLFAAGGSQIGYLAGALTGPGESRRGLRSGRITIDQAGVNFRATRNDGHSRDTSLAWQQLSRLDVTPGSSPASARIKVVTTDGQTVTWFVNGFQDLSRALSHLQSSPAGG
jgi:hypothetical protein